MAKKKTKPTDIIVVLDRSGSMDSIGKSTVEGFNTFLKEQKAAKGEATLTLIQFDNEIQTDYLNEQLTNVKDLVLGETFVPRATTALFDAVGQTIAKTKTKNDVVFVIITDGFENASREYDQSKVFKMIEDKKKEGWNFLFLAANQDAMKSGAAIGISASNSMTFNANEASNSKMYMNFSSKISSYRSAKADMLNVAAVADTLAFTDEDRKDVQN
jgi:Mg-chelatase subunit ChlD